MAGNVRYKFRAYVTVTAMVLLSACATQQKPWLTEHLTEEFTVAKSQQVASFDDYLELEDRLFAELAARVYAKTGSGSSYELLRFSNGAAADPRQFSPNWNRSFELHTEAPHGGVLLLHGMSDSPYSLRALGQALHDRGYQVLGLRLPGHGTAPSGLTTVRWEDMAGAVRLAMNHLSAQLGNKPIHIVGYSAGAALALEFTLEALDGRAFPLPTSLVLVSPAIGISAAAGLASWKRRLSIIPGLGSLGWLVVEPEFDPYKYNSFATNAGEQVHRLTRRVSSRIERHARSGTVGSFPPILVFKSNADATVSTQAVVDRLLTHLSPDRHELVLFDVNRMAAKSVLKFYDPRALDTRVMGDPNLPFGVTLVGNDNADSQAVVARHQPPFSADVATTEPLGLTWPSNILSLSHVALPIPSDDPLYGRRPPDNDDLLFLGEIAFQGERGMFLLSSDWLLRLRNNPFYAYLQTTAIDWMRDAENSAAESTIGLSH